MASPIFIGVGTEAKVVTNNTDKSVTVPAGVVDGDLLLYVRTAENSATQTIHIPPGFTLVHRRGAPDVFSSNVYVYQKIAASEPTSYALTTASQVTGNARVFAWSGASLISTVTSKTQAGAALTTSAITAATAESLLIALAFEYNTHAYTYTPTAPLETLGTLYSNAAFPACVMSVPVASAGVVPSYGITCSAAGDNHIVSLLIAPSGSGPAPDTTPPTLTGSITASAITQTSYTLSWPTGADNTAVTAYEYSIAGGAYVSNGTATAVNISGRTAGTTDAVTVRAKDAAGNVSTPVLSTNVTLLSAVVPGITTPTLKNNTGTVLANETGVVVNVYNASTGALVLAKTGLTSSAAGIVTFTDAALTLGTSYAYEVILSGGRRRLPLVVAA